jgi:hypothetical protein
MSFRPVARFALALTTVAGLSACGQAAAPATSFGLGMAETARPVNALPPAESPLDGTYMNLAALENIVRDLAAEKRLNPAQQRALLADLEGADLALQAGDTASAIAALEGFEAATDEKNLRRKDPAAAEQLRLAARAVIESL